MNGFTSKSECHKALYFDLFVLLRIKDIVYRFFADDTSLFLIVDNTMTAALCLNSDLNPLSRRAPIWLVTSNPSKYITLSLFYRKNNKPFHPPKI